VREFPIVAASNKGDGHECDCKSFLEYDSINPTRFRHSENGCYVLRRRLVDFAGSSLVGVTLFANRTSSAQCDVLDMSGGFSGAAVADHWDVVPLYGGVISRARLNAFI
jgi:hypothetical protein